MRNLDFGVPEGGAHAKHAHAFAKLNHAFGAAGLAFCGSFWGGDRGMNLAFHSAPFIFLRFRSFLLRGVASNGAPPLGVHVTALGAGAPVAVHVGDDARVAEVQNLADSNWMWLRALQVTGALNPPHPPPRGRTAVPFQAP